jgi:hypothetical protein
MTARDQYTAGLRALADWLDANPGAPIPATTVVYVPVANRITLAAIASTCYLGTATDDTTSSAMRRFGPVLYDAFTYAPGCGPAAVSETAEPF